MPSVTIKPTLEYDSKQHTLRGPVARGCRKASGARIGASTAFLVRAIDGYAVVLSATEASSRKFILATHLDGRPMALGGLGPIWAVYDADLFPDMAAKPVNERFGLCPWATYHIEVNKLICAPGTAVAAPAPREVVGSLALPAPRPQRRRRVTVVALSRASGGPSVRQTVPSVHGSLPAVPPHSSVGPRGTSRCAVRPVHPAAPSVWRRGQPSPRKTGNFAPSDGRPYRLAGPGCRHAALCSGSPACFLPTEGFRLVLRPVARTHAEGTSCGFSSA